jgi:hypothetical protein
VQIIIPVGCQIFRRMRRIEKHIPICVVERMSQRKTDGLQICRRSIEWLSCKRYGGLSSLLVLRKLEKNKG